MATNIKTINTGSSRISNNLNRLDSFNTANSNRYEGNIRTFNDQTINRQKWATIFGIGSSVGGTAMSVGSSIGANAIGLTIAGGALSVLGAVGQGIFGIASARSQYNSQLEQEKYNKYQTYYSALAQNMAYYGSALENRDDILFGVNQQINSSITSMSNTYGAGFTSALRSVFYGKNGIDSSINSVFGSYKTFNEIGSGTVAGWNEGELYDVSELTSDASNYFNNNYTDLELSDLNEKITNRLYNLLMGADTSFAKEVKGYETDVRNLISNSLMARRQTIQQYAKQFSDLATQKQGADINSAIALGQAQASSAISGLRGASSSRNVAIQKLSQAMADMEYTTQIAYGMVQMQNAIQNIQVNVSQQVASRRSSEQLALKKATENAINSWNQGVVSTARSGEYEGNKALREAYQYSQEMERNKQKIYGLLGS